MKKFLKTDGFCLGLLLVIYICLTIHTINFGFVYDDRYLISGFLEVPIKFFFKSSYEYAKFHFYPVYFLSHLLDSAISFKFFHIKDYLDTSRWIIPRISNLIYHFINAILIYKLIPKIFKTNNKIIITASTFFFLFHPAVSQPLFNVTARNELLYLMFCLAAFHASFEFLKKENVKNILIFNFLLALGLYSKALAVFFIILIPLFHILEMYSNNNLNKNNIDKIGIILVTSFLNLFLYIYLRSIFTKDYDLVIDQNILNNLLSSISFYTQNFLIPIDHLYAIPKRELYPIGIFCFLILTIPFIFSVMLILKKKEITLFFIFSWIGGSLALPIYFGLMTTSSFPLNSELAERYTYGSIPAFSFLITYMLLKLNRINLKKIFIFPFILFFGIITSFLLFERSKVYKNDVVFWSKAKLTHGYHHFFFSTVPGYINSMQNNFPKSILYLYESSYLFKDSILSLALIAQTYEQIGKFEVSEYYWEKINNQFGGHPEMLLYNGNQLLAENKFKEALDKYLDAEKIYISKNNEWSKVPKLNGYDSMVKDLSTDTLFFNIGVCYANLNKKRKALEYFTKAFKYNYNHTTAKYNAAVIYKEFGEMEQAIKLLNEATIQNPRFKFIMDEKLRK